MKTFLQIITGLASFPYFITAMWFFLGPMLYGWTPGIDVATVYCISTVVFVCASIPLMLKESNFIDNGGLVGAVVVAILVGGFFLWDIPSLFEHRGVENGVFLYFQLFLTPWWLVFIVYVIGKAASRLNDT